MRCEDSDRVREWYCGWDVVRKGVSEVLIDGASLIVIYVHIIVLVNDYIGGIVKEVGIIPIG